MIKTSKSKIMDNEEDRIYNWDDLYQLWKDIPIIKTSSDVMDFKTSSHPIQYAITKILRRGIEEKTGRKRHFLTANELLDEVNKRREGIDNPIKISMLYYHLDKLIEVEFVKYVYHVEGRHKRKYFGRTAKFYLFSDSEKENDKMKQYFSPISKLLVHFNPEINVEKYEKYVDEIKEAQSAFSNKLVEWMRENHELLFELEIDALELFSSLNSFLIGQSSIKKLYSPLLNHM
ncbi:MAG: hypothetical protein ACW99A_23730, partial [Candidatus Kariarchaeaceae archaeon]